MQQLITHIPNDSHYQRYEDYLNQDPAKYLEPEACNQWLKETNPDSLPVAAVLPTPSLGKKLVRGCSWLLNFPPLVLCTWVLRKIGDPVFSSSIKFLTGIIVFPIYYLGLWVSLGFIYDFWISSGLVVLAVLSLWMRKWALS